MLGWYTALPAALQDVVYGFTVLNEPGLGVVSGGGPPPRPGNTGLPDNSLILQWLAEAVGIYKASVVNTRTAAKQQVPLLYMNMHESAFPGIDPHGQMGAAMQVRPTSGSTVFPRSWHTSPPCYPNVVLFVRRYCILLQMMGLANTAWAVLDIHHYFAWDAGGGGIPAGQCSSASDLAGFVKRGMATWLANVTATATAYSIANVACSEWALSLHHTDLVAPCALDESTAASVMYDEQVAAFSAASVSNFMWGWRMPQGGSHEAFWSMKLHLTGEH